MLYPLADQVMTLSGWAMLGVLTAVSLVAMTAAGVFRRRDGATVERLLSGGGLGGRLLLNAGLAVFVYVFVSTVAYVVLRAMGRIDLSKVGEDSFSPGVLILLSVVVPAVTLVCLLLGLKLLVPGGPARIGLSGEAVGKAVWPAIGFAVAVLPFIFLISNVAEAIYERIGWEHPMEHPLLQSMGASGGTMAKLMGVLAAVVLAPLSEEILFRGHLQTALRQIIFYLRAGRLWRGPMSMAANPIEQPAPGDPGVPPPLPEGAVPPIPVLPYGVATPESAITLASVLAVIVTSLMFAAVHPGWSRPPIFVLSLFLGLAYERRGNLWTCVFIHAIFNAVMVSAFLSMAHGAS